MRVAEEVAVEPAPKVYETGRTGGLEVAEVVAVVGSHPLVEVAAVALVTALRKRLLHTIRWSSR